VFTTAYHPQTNGQVERYNRTILASLRGYVAARQDDWDAYTSAVTFAYNCRVHASLGMPPFELALTRPPRSLSLQSQPRTEERAPNTLKKEFLERLKTLRLRAGMNLQQAQAGYKKIFDRGVSRKNVDLQEGDEAYVRVEVTDVGRNHKLESFVQGPYRVMENAGSTFRLKIGEETVRISSDRVTRAPSRSDPPADEDGSPVRIRAPTTVQDPAPVLNADPPTPDRVSSPVPDEGVPAVFIPSPRTPREERRVRSTLPDGTQVPTRDKTRSLGVPEQGYVVDKLVDVLEAVDGSSQVYCVRWLGYNPDEDTWEPEDNLPKHFIRRYWKYKGITTCSEVLTP
jgi:Chromo (CHRromatin Organisation MOdifier) domain